jgi:hypothetical protein
VQQRNQKVQIFWDGGSTYGDAVADRNRNGGSSSPAAASPDGPDVLHESTFFLEVFMSPHADMLWLVLPTTVSTSGGSEEYLAAGAGGSAASSGNPGYADAAARAWEPRVPRAGA